MSFISTFLQMYTSYLCISTFTPSFTSIYLHFYFYLFMYLSVSTFIYFCLSIVRFCFFSVNSRFNFLFISQPRIGVHLHFVGFIY